MKYGIYYAFWEKEWRADFIPYIEKAKELGFDILEITTADFANISEAQLDELCKAAQYNNVLLTGGYGPRPEHNIGACNCELVEKTFSFYKMMFGKMERVGIRSLGGALYSYWPVDFSGPVDKERDRDRSVRGMRRLAAMAQDYGITLNMEALNRFEGYLINDAAECAAYVREVDRVNVKVMLDTFHMNIEEDNFRDAIHATGGLLGHLHIGECNRKLPGQGRMDWDEVAVALHNIGYDGNVVMEPFVLMGGQVGKDIKVWRDMSQGMTQDQIDRAVTKSLHFIKGKFEWYKA